MSQIERCGFTLVVPYEPDVSVNHAYNRGSARYGVKPHVDMWLKMLKIAANRLIGTLYPAEYSEPVTLDLQIIVPMRKGRLPDTSNFRKLIQDTLAVCLDVDDSCFGGTDTPARRVAKGEEPGILIVLEWAVEKEAPLGG